MSSQLQQSQHQALLECFAQVPSAEACPLTEPKPDATTTKETYQELAKMTCLAERITLAIKTREEVGCWYLYIPTHEYYDVLRSLPVISTALEKHWKVHLADYVDTGLSALVGISVSSSLV